MLYKHDSHASFIDATDHRMIFFKQELAQALAQVRRAATSPARTSTRCQCHHLLLATRKRGGALGSANSHLFLMCRSKAEWLAVGSSAISAVGSC